MPALPTRLPVILSWSGGKDSSLALEALRASVEYEVVALLTSVTRDYDRVSIHGVRRSLLQAQAAALELPLLELTLDAACSNEAYEAAFVAAVADARTVFPAVGHIAFGDLYLADVRAYRERLVTQTGLAPLFPLWLLPTAALARTFISRGYVAHLVCVDTTQLDGTYAGARYDAALLDALPPTVDPCGENGEFHTFVSDGPGFVRAVEVEVGERVLREGRFVYCDMVDAAGAGSRPKTAN